MRSWLAMLLSDEVEVIGAQYDGNKLLNFASVRPSTPGVHARARSRWRCP